MAKKPATKAKIIAKIEDGGVVVVLEVAKLVQDDVVDTMNGGLDEGES